MKKRIQAYYASRRNTIITQQDDIFKKKAMPVVLKQNHLAYVGISQHLNNVQLHLQYRRPYKGVNVMLAMLKAFM